MENNAVVTRRPSFAGKRFFDLAVVVLSLPVTLPVLAGLSVLVRVFLGSPVLFRQPRPGLHGRVFTLFKFRTMTDQRDASGTLLPDAVRLTSFGRLLRSTSLDELPELINVLRGEMSLIGPRPLLVHYLPHYTPEQAHRHDVPPGITGWAQINGRNAIGWDEKFKLDLWYVDHQGWWLDLRILFLTFWKVLSRQEVNAPGSVTMPAFAPPPGESPAPPAPRR